MEQRFGTPFLHVADMQEWHGIEGISDLYRQIGKMLGCENAVERVLQEEYERVAARYQELRADFAKYKFCLIAHGIAYLPDALRVYQQDYGLPITKICIIMNPSYQAETGLDDAMMQRFKDRIELAKAEYGCDAEILLEPSEDALREAAQAVILLSATVIRAMLLWMFPCFIICLTARCGLIRALWILWKRFGRCCNNRSEQAAIFC